MEEDSQKVTGTQSIDRASDLLVRVLASETPLTLTNLVAATGLAKGTTSRILSALERAGLLERGPQGGFQAGPVLNQYAISGGAYSALVNAVQPAMARVAEITGETVNIGVAGHNGIDSIAQVAGTYLLGARDWVGESVPAHCSAQGKVLMAYGVCAVPRVLEARTEFSITNFQALDQELRKVRDFGYAVSRNELENGLVAIAVPVKSESGTVLGSMSVTGPAERIQPADESRIATILRNELQASSKPSEEGAA